MPDVIALLTDFGTQDAYVAAMRGVIVGGAPQVRLIDITHHVPPQDIYYGAFVLNSVVGVFPPNTVYLAVVDPGVGTDRPALVVTTPDGLFVGPDNGLFSYIYARYGALRAMSDRRIPPVVQAAPAPGGVQAHHITNDSLFRHPVSRTFHGRDIFSPVAAFLATGGSPDDVGPAVASVQAYGPPQPLRGQQGAVLGRVVHIDSYGNLITNLREPDLPGSEFRMDVGGHTITHLSESYANGEALLAISGSSGFVEVAAKGGSAAHRLGLGRWAPLLVRPPASATLRG